MGSTAPAVDEFQSTGAHSIVRVLLDEYGDEYRNLTVPMQGLLIGSLQTESLADFIRRHPPGSVETLTRGGRNWEAGPLHWQLNQLLEMHLDWGFDK